MVGSCCALHLQRAGHKVALIDPHPPGSQTSYGNAATIATYACIPVNHPKLLKSLPALLSGPDRPLSISPGYALRMLPWFFSFLRHCRRERVDHTISVPFLQCLLQSALRDRWPLVSSTRRPYLRRFVVLLFRKRKNLLLLLLSSLGASSVAPAGTGRRLGGAEEAPQAPGSAMRRARQVQLESIQKWWSSLSRMAKCANTSNSSKRSRFLRIAL